MKSLIPIALLTASATATPHKISHYSPSLAARAAKPWCTISLNITDVLPHNADGTPSQTTLSAKVKDPNGKLIPTSWKSSIPFSSPPTSHSPAMLNGITADKRPMSISFDYKKGAINTSEWLSFRFGGNHDWDDTVEGCSRTAWVDVAGQVRTRSSECWFWCPASVDNGPM
ncbi:hypothetical protein CC86DRAFT_405050 [Ophiobolus disseminans]|uniref:Uncharacterized protein n=1 Tax=Ophiobolus disseminans TaxID=1469910 RepID=A0A6A7A5B5_9PLEO|nr:hypothetical protein CC86DRAFT_405050 [Ophiobolus disseminans]